MVSFEDEDEIFLTKYLKLAARMSSFIKNKQGHCLYTVKIKGKGKGFYWSLSDRAFVWIDKGADFYWVDRGMKRADTAYLHHILLVLVYYCLYQKKKYNGLV